MPQSLHVNSSQVHLRWSRDIEPVLRVHSGAEIMFDLKDGGNNQIRPDNAAEAMSAFDFSLADPAFGPVFVEGAEPGDVLQVEILELVPADYGWTGIFPGFGLLSDEFPEPRLKMWDLTDAGTVKAETNAEAEVKGREDDGKVLPVRRAVFKPGISVPVRPFLGVAGTAPAEAGDFSTIPPYPKTGGNMDCRYLCAGAVLKMPVQVTGALFSCGDGHAAQGDGEVCGTAIETPMWARLRLKVQKKTTPGNVLESPHVVVPPDHIDAQEGSMGHYVALGIDADPREAARIALKGLIDWLETEKGLERWEGYMLASVAASLRMSQVVDMPNFTLSCSIPLKTFSAVA